jgi:undecaprenyl-diphosphatase
VLIGIILGIIQGIAEWLPVSSEGVVTAAYGFMKNRPLSEALTFALWLHLGTVISVLAVFWRTLLGLVKEVVSSPKDPPPIFWFLLVSTLVSAAIAFPILLTLDDVSTRFGTAAMGIVGVMMFVTGGLQLRKRVEGRRTKEDLSIWDALGAGIAQGFAVIPGLSRSGLTMSVLLARRMERKEALVLSFLMSVPASLGVGVYTSIDSGLLASGEALLAMGVAAVVGLFTIKALLAVADRINFGLFVIIVGAAIVGGALWQWLAPP